MEAFKKLLILHRLMNRCYVSLRVALGAPCFFSCQWATGIFSVCLARDLRMGQRAPWFQ